MLIFQAKYVTFILAVAALADPAALTRTVLLVKHKESGVIQDWRKIAKVF